MSLKWLTGTVLVPAVLWSMFVAVPWAEAQPSNGRQVSPLRPVISPGQRVQGSPFLPKTALPPNPLPIEPGPGSPMPQPQPGPGPQPGNPGQPGDPNTPPNPGTPEPMPGGVQLGIQGVDLPNAQGVHIVQVQPNSVAERLGLEVGDVIVQVNGLPIRSGSDLRVVLSMAGGSLRILAFDHRTRTYQILQDAPSSQPYTVSRVKR